MTKKKKTVEFEEGWADELMDEMEMTQDEIDNLMRGIIQLVETGEIFEEAIPVEELDKEEREEIYAKLNAPKNTRH
jgi:hypothetical protein